MLKYLSGILERNSGRGGEDVVRKRLEAIVGHLSDEEFAIVCRIATDDLMFNRVKFGKRTSLDYVISIMARCAEVFKKCA